MFANRSLLERILRVVVEDRRCPADRLRPEARAGPVGGGGIEGNAPDDGIDVLQVLRVAAAHEGEDAGMRRVRRSAFERFRGNRVIDGLVGQFVLLKIAGNVDNRRTDGKGEGADFVRKALGGRRDAHVLRLMPVRSRASRTADFQHSCGSAPESCPVSLQSAVRRPAS